MSKPDDYLWDRSGPPDPDVERLEDLLRPLAHDAPLDELRLRRRRRLGPWIAGAFAVASAAAALAIVLRPDPQRPCGGDNGFTFTGQGGTVSCDGSQVVSGMLPVGGMLDTGANQALLRIADIGTAVLGAETRVRLDRTSTERHQLFLERGRMHARVNAPPRIFAVATPSSQVVDLGCEYEIQIDERGSGTIGVLTGKVELEHASGAVFVAPGRTHTRLLAGRRASLPLIEHASNAVTAAVAAWDATGGLDGILAAATPADAITIANLAKIESPRRADVLVRLQELFPAPQQLTIVEALADPVMFGMWFDEVLLQYFLANDQRK